MLARLSLPTGMCLYGILKKSCCFQLPRQLPHYVWRFSEVADSFKFVQKIVASQISVHLGETTSNNNSVQLNTFQSFSLHQGRPDLNSSLWVTSGFVLNTLGISWWLVIRPLLLADFFLLAQTKVLLTFPEIYCWCFRNPVNSPVEVGSLSHYLQGFFYTSQVVIAGFLNHEQYPLAYRKQPQGWYHRKTFSFSASGEGWGFFTFRCWFKIQSLKQALETDGSMFCWRVVRKKNIYIYIYTDTYINIHLPFWKTGIHCFVLVFFGAFFFRWQILGVCRWKNSVCVWEGDAGIMPFVGLGRSGTDPPPMSEGWRRKMISKLSTRCDLCNFLVFDRFDLLIWCVSRIPSRLLILWLQEHVLNNWWTPATSSIYTL